jgi:DNA-binding NarL/FixJ family response regulator
MRALVKANVKTRVLVVDDHQPFRRLVCSILQAQGNLQVVGEAQDGVEAVRQAELLQPDLVVLDIGLPGLNGIEVARQISKIASVARIIFLTQECSPDVVKEAFAVGAQGYVVKAQAGAELLAAVAEVSNGSKFVSSGIDGDSKPRMA